MISNCTSSKYFFILHSNIRSLNANFYNFMQMVAELNHKKMNIANDRAVCANILEYQFISQPSQSNAGGVGFFF